MTVPLGKNLTQQCGTPEFAAPEIITSGGGVCAFVCVCVCICVNMYVSESAAPEISTGGGSVCAFVFVCVYMYVVCVHLFSYF